jgi:hypothetical protein
VQFQILMLFGAQAHAQGLQRKFESAHLILDSIKKEALTLPVAEVRYLLERGRVLNSAKRQPETFPRPSRFLKKLS